MKTTLFIVLALGEFISPNATFAQSSSVIRVKGGAGGEKTVPFADRYRYAQFRDGTVVFQSGTTAAARLNYNVVLGEMQFINPSGDTLALADDPVVRMVGVGQDVFWYDPSRGYSEIIADFSTVKLAAKQGLKTVKNEKGGGYGQSSGASAVTNYQFYSGGNTSVRKLDTKGDVLLIKDKAYFIIDQNGRFQPANKVGVLKVFGKHKKEMNDYLTREPVDFGQEESLKKLLKYGSELL